MNYISVYIYISIFMKFMILLHHQTTALMFLFDEYYTEALK